MNKNQIIGIVLVILILLIFVDPIFAGPGGTIAKGLFKTWWGKIIMVVLVILLLPVIIYVRFREYFGVRKTKKELTKLGMINADFLPLNLDKNVRNVFQRVYLAWSDEKMEVVSDYVSSWYWQNQQLVVLDRWKENNLQNICKLKKINKIKPLYLQISSEENLENSRIVFSITANIEDYLIERGTSKVVEGRKGFMNEEKIWIMEYQHGNWVLDDIQDGQLSLAFAKMENVIPENLLDSPILRKP